MGGGEGGGEGEGRRWYSELQKCEDKFLVSPLHSLLHLPSVRICVPGLVSLEVCTEPAHYLLAHKVPKQTDRQTDRLQVYLHLSVVVLPWVYGSDHIVQLHIREVVVHTNGLEHSLVELLTVLRVDITLKCEEEKKMFT